MTLCAFFVGFLRSAPAWVWLVPVGAAIAFGYCSFPLYAWTLWCAALLLSLAAPLWVWCIFAGLALVFNLTFVRRYLVSLPLMKVMKALRFLPSISETERTAIEAGTVWVDRELFSGKPDFDRLLKESYPDLNSRERSFLEGPVAQVCRMTQDWKVFETRDLPADVWEFLKEQRFFGLIIPEEHGGMGFSASGVSAVVTRLASRSMPLAITVMVPNSLGPAELLIHYGTDEQKARLLPRLARGEEIPCFALTEPGAGSDAASITSHGVLFKGDDGLLYIRLHWKKRYITLAAISTLLGLAFKLRDPHQILGKGEDLGITCALIPTSTQGVILGKRHDPMGVPFYNCPTEGVDVVVPLDCVIGGLNGVGQGWRMLMECLAAGRGISLPAAATAGTQMAARVAGAYAVVRRQFGTSIGKFEGIEEPLARIGGHAYLLEAARRYTCGGLDGGNKPAVVSAIMKLGSTEIARRCVNDAMDILGGAGISLGPRNLLGHSYVGMPISITVEGANILTRSLMIFGQGAIRCHPYAYTEIDALAKGDVRKFDAAFFAHIGHVVRNGCRALVLSLTRGVIAQAPVAGPAVPYCKKLSWCSASFAFLADLAMSGLGGDLKRRETITGRFSDIFSWMYLASAALRRFEAEGRRTEDLPFLHWSMRHALSTIQQAFDELYANLQIPGFSWLINGPVAWWSRVNPIARPPSDRLVHQVAQALQAPGAQRDSLTPSIDRQSSIEEPLTRLDRAHELCFAADKVAQKLRAAVKEKRLPKLPPDQLVAKALEGGVISREEAELVRNAEAAREDVIQVDSFSLKEYLVRRSAEPSSPQSSDLVTTPPGLSSP